MARRRRHMPLASPKSSTLPLETPTQSLKSLAQQSGNDEQSSHPPSQPEIQPVKLLSSMPIQSALQPISAEQESLGPGPLDAYDATVNRVRTRASMRRLELLKTEDEKPQLETLEQRTLVAIHSSCQPHSPKLQPLVSQHLNSSGSTNRMRTRASMRSLELLTKEEQQPQPQPVELQSSASIHSAPQQESLEPQPLDASCSIKSQKRILAAMQLPEEGWCKFQLVDQQSSLPRTQSQPYCVGPESPAPIHCAPKAGFPEQQPLESQPLDSSGISVLATSSCSGKKRKRTRGPTRCLDLLTREDEQLLHVAANEFGQPIGPNARKLTSFLGTITRDPKKAPLLWHDWRAMPQEYKDCMWENVQEKFQVGDDLKDWVMMSLATKWRNFKAYLKKKYYDGKVGKDCLVINDKRVDPAHWQELVCFWDSEKGQLRSSTNKANRAKLHAIHTAGSKSFAMIREELRIKRLDLQNPSLTEVYVLTHTRRDGQPVDEASAVVMAKLTEQVSEQETSECITTKDEVLTQILGEDRHGRVRTFGLGPSPTDIYGPKPSRNQALQLVNEIKKIAEEKLTKMTEQMKAMKDEQEGMKAEQEEMKQKYEDRLAVLQTQLQTVVQMVQGNNMNFKALEQFSLQQFVSSASSHLLEPSKATSTLGMENGFPNILRRRKVIGEIPSQYTASHE